MFSRKILITAFVVIGVHCQNIFYDFDDVVPVNVPDRNNYRNNLVTIEKERTDNSTAANQDKVMRRSVVPCKDYESYKNRCFQLSESIFELPVLVPPLPSRIDDWCRALKLLVNCSNTWNTVCRYPRFDEEVLLSQSLLISTICNNEDYLSKYKKIEKCIASTADVWEMCYAVFKNTVDGEKGGSRSLTHYKTHFVLCCARSHFRKCTLKAVLQNSNSECTESETLTLQKFSVYISQSEVRQTCENLLYQNCPGGDPRPTPGIIKKLLNVLSYVTEMGKLRRV